MDIKRYLPGVVTVLLIAFFSYVLSTVNASFDSLVVSIIIGMFLGNLLARPAGLRDGIEGSLRVFLPAGIALYGAQLVLTRMQGSYIAMIFVVFIGLFGFTLLIARVFNIETRAAVLLASGLSICGASAIAVISPLIGARREDTSIAIISVMMLGLTGMIFYPLLYDFFSLSRNEFNFLCGTTLPMLGQVKVAAGSACPECLGQAVNIKLIRMSFLFFLVTAAIFLSGGEKKGVRVPWFVIVFIVLALLVNTTSLLNRFLGPMKTLSSFFLSSGLAAIGFSVDFDAIVEEGTTPLGVIFFSWGVVILLMYLVRNLF